MIENADSARYSESSPAAKPIKVAISGINGRMGRFCARQFLSSAQVKLVGGVGKPGATYIGEDIGILLGLAKSDSFVYDNCRKLFETEKPDIILDFSSPEGASECARLALEYGVSPIIGTSGLPSALVKDIQALAGEKEIGAMLVPNFSIGAVLMVELSRLAAGFFSHVEIVEMHHTKKVDAPSGTSMHTADKLANLNQLFNQCRSGMEEREITPGARGSQLDSGVRVHSLRLPGLVARQDVIFGAEGELLTIRHETINLECLVKGIDMAINAVSTMKKMYIGLETILLPLLLGACEEANCPKVTACVSEGLPKEERIESKTEDCQHV